MNEDMERKWDEAFANPGEAIPVGDIVLCDDCSVDYTNRPDSGGFIFQSKAICPVCAPRWRRLIALYGEQHFIKSVCAEGVTFAAFVRAWRGPKRDNPGDAGAAMKAPQYRHVGAGLDRGRRRKSPRKCRVCGCTDDDCRQCIEKIGAPCYWVEPDLCSACNEDRRP
jgi:hypothetical protein